MSIEWKSKLGPSIAIVPKWFEMKTRFIDVGVFFSLSMSVVPIVASVLIYIHAHIVVHIRTFQRHLKVIRYFFVWNIWFFITNVSIFSMIINFKFHNIIQCAMCNVNERNTSVFEINSMREILYAFISVIFACYLRLQCVCFFSLSVSLSPQKFCATSSKIFSFFHSENRYQ